MRSVEEMGLSSLDLGPPPSTSSWYRSFSEPDPLFGPKMFWWVYVVPARCLFWRRWHPPAGGGMSGRLLRPMRRRIEGVDLVRARCLPVD